MENILELITAIKNLDNAMVAWDKGRLIIKQEFSSFKSKATLTNVKLNTTLIYPYLLYPEDRIPRQNIDLWLNQLLNKANNIEQNIVNTDSMKIANLFNLGALLFCCLGKIKLAKKLCEIQIELFIKLGERNIALLHHIFQPWINIARIDRQLGLIESALIKFNFLLFYINKTHQIKHSFGSIKINNEALKQSLALNPLTQQVIHVCAHLEPIKTYLIAKQYQMLIKKLSIIKDKSHPLIAINYEALIIAYIKTNQYKEALKLAEIAIDNVSPALTPLFLLRQSEIYASIYPKNRVVKNIIENNFQKLYRLTSSISVLNVDIKQAYFTTRLATQMLNCGYKMLAKLTFNKALLFAVKTNDELLQITCMESLIALGDHTIAAGVLSSTIVNSGYYEISKRFTLKHSKRKSMQNMFAKADLLMKILNKLALTLQEV